MAKSLPKKPPHLYGPKQMPRVDAHMHIRDREDKEFPKPQAKLIRIMNQSGITISINLSGKRGTVDLADKIHKKWKGRILIAPGHYFRTDKAEDLWWSKKDLRRFKESGCAGLKIWPQYHQVLWKRKGIVDKIRYQGELGLPVLGLHVSDPPTRGFWRPNYWDCILEAEKMIKACPGTTFVMAHGYWLMQQNKGLDLLGKYFDKYPNLNVDLSAVYQWWNAPEPDHTKLRRFCLKYQDRLLYGTDGHQEYSEKFRFERSYEMLETKKKHLRGFFGGDKERTFTTGLDLPKEVLNKIYYWNAARLIPRVHESLLGLGYKV